MNIYIDEKLEVLTAICLLSENENVVTAFRQYEFIYIPAVKKELDFLKEFSLYYFIKKQGRKFSISKLLNNKKFIKELNEITKDKRWKNWWNSWENNINDLKTYYHNLICSLKIEKYDYELIIPLYLKNTFIKKENNKTYLISNFGISFEENIQNIQTEKHFLRDDESKILFNMLSTLEIVKNKQNFFKINKWYEINQILPNKKAKKIDFYLNNKIDNYNFNFDNYFGSTKVTKIKSKYICKYSNLLPQKFKDEIKKSQIILFGEQHYAASHETFLCNNLNEFYLLGIRTICIEIPSIYQTSIDLFLTNKEKSLNKNIYMLRDFIYKIKKFNESFSEGERLKVYCVDFDTKFLSTKESWKIREQVISKNIINIISNNNKKMFCIFGSFHVQKNKIFYLFRNDNIKTLGQILSEKYNVFSINTFALKGEENTGTLSFPIKFIFSLNKKLPTNFKYLNNSSNAFFLFYEAKKMQTVYIDSFIYKKIKKEEIPFDVTLVFYNQTIAEWVKDYE